MKATGMVRNIDELGRIVVPKEIRTKMDINDTDPIEIYVDGDKIILAKYENACSICGIGNSELVNFKKKKLCKNCINEIKAI